MVLFLLVKGSRAGLELVWVEMVLWGAGKVGVVYCSE